MTYASYVIFCLMSINKNIFSFKPAYFLAFSKCSKLTLYIFRSCMLWFMYCRRWASENIVQIIVNSLWALFMKMQVSVSEATDCLRKMIGGESMGNWFENMEPMNIQEERANTKRERERADQAEEERDRAEEKLNKTEVERDKAEKTLMDLMKKVYGTKENVIKNLVESCDKTEEEAKQLIQKYW